MDESNVSRLQRDFRNLAILEIIIGGGLCLASLIIPPLSKLFDSGSKGLVPIATAIIGGTGCIFVVISYLFVAMVTIQIKLASLGSIGLACMIATFGLALQPASCHLVITFLIGAIFLVSGIGLWRMYGWSRIIQGILFIALFVSLAYLAIFLWQFSYSWRLRLKELTLIALLFSSSISLIAGLPMSHRQNRRTVAQRVGYFLLVAGILYVVHLFLNEYFFWESLLELLIIVGGLLVAISFGKTFFLLQHPDSKALFSPPEDSRPEIVSLTLSGIGAPTLIVSFLCLWFFTGVSVPSFLSALQRGKQGRTMADFRALSIVMEVYASDHNEAYPAAKTIEELARMVEPKYIKVLPRNDGWGRTIEYTRVLISETGVYGFVFRSAGRDGKFEHIATTAYPDEAVEGFDRDIVYSTVSGSQWPDGMMRP